MVEMFKGHTCGIVNQRTALHNNCHTKLRVFVPTCSTVYMCWSHFSCGRWHPHGCLSVDYGCKWSGQFPLCFITVSELFLTIATTLCSIGMMLTQVFHPKNKFAPTSAVYKQQGYTRFLSERRIVSINLSSLLLLIAEMSTWVNVTVFVSARELQLDTSRRTDLLPLRYWNFHVQLVVLIFIYGNHYNICSCPIYTRHCYCECWECKWLHSWCQSDLEDNSTTRVCDIL